jgi:ribosomal protein S27E
MSHPKMILMFRVDISQLIIIHHDFQFASLTSDSLTSKWYKPITRYFCNSFECFKNVHIPSLHTHCISHKYIIYIHLYSAFLQTKISYIQQPISKTANTNGHFLNVKAENCTWSNTQFLYTSTKFSRISKRLHFPRDIFQKK